MKNSIKLFMLLVLVSVPAAIFAQGDAKHAINTKGAGANDKLVPCPAPDQSLVIAAQERLKTRTKSNNANERTSTKGTQVSIALLRAGCAETTAVDPGQPISFTWKPDSLRRKFTFRIWQLKEGQTIADGMAAGNLVFEKIIDDADFFDMDAPPRRPRDVSTSFVWEVQALDAGKAAGTPLISTYDLATLKK